MRLGADDVSAFRIPHHKIGIAPDGDSSFARIEAHELCRRGGDKLHEAVHAPAAFDDAPFVQQMQTVFHTGKPVRDLAEVLSSQFLLFGESFESFFHTKRAVICGNRLEIVGFKGLPEKLLVGALANRRGANVFRPIKAPVGIVFVREEEILRARFAVCRQAAVARLAYLFHRPMGRNMYDIDGHACHLAECNNTVRRFLLRRRRA